MRKHNDETDESSILQNQFTAYLAKFYGLMLWSGVHNTPDRPQTKCRIAAACK